MEVRRMIKVLVVSDLHTGHRVGLWHPDAEAQGSKYRMNHLQRYLYKNWLDLLEKARLIKPDILVLNGDLCDGPGKKSEGMEQHTTSMNDQENAATMLIEPFTKLVKEVYVTQGTPYHVRSGGQSDDNVGKALGAKGPTRQTYSYDTLDLPLGLINLNFHHGISTSVGFYRLTALDREGIFSALAGREGKLPPAHVVVRSHVHFFAHAEHPTKHIVTTPAWQLQTAYMRKNSVYRLLPDIGAILIEIDPKVPKWDDPVEVKKILYPLPRVRVAKSGVV